MKAIILSIIFAILLEKSFCQTAPDTALSKDDYLRKSKDQKIAAWVMAGAGTIFFLAGVQKVSNSFLDNPDTANGSGAFLIAGTCLVVGSLPLHINSKRNAVKATELSLGTPAIFLPRQTESAFKIQPTLTLKIGL
jgi:hypothetical protein